MRILSKNDILKMYLNFAVATTVFVRVLVEPATATASTDVTGPERPSTAAATTSDGERRFALDDIGFFAFGGLFTASVGTVTLLRGRFTPAASTSIPRSSSSASGASTPAVCRVRRSFDRYSFGSGNVGRFVSLFADDDVEFHDLAVAHRPDGLFGVIFDDGGLVDEDILFRVVSVDEAVAGLDVEPLDGAGDFGGDDLFGLLVFDGAVLAGLFAVGLNDVLGRRAVVCGRCCAVLRVAHDGKMVRLTT